MTRGVGHTTRGTGHHHGDRTAPHPTYTLLAPASDITSRHILVQTASRLPSHISSEVTSHLSPHSVTTTFTHGVRCHVHTASRLP